MAQLGAASCTQYALSARETTSFAFTVPLYGYVQRFDAKGNLALLALGMNGVQRIDL